MTLLEKTLQTVGEARPTVGVNDDDLQAGYDGVAGGFLSYPLGLNLGSHKWFASNNAGNYACSTTNAAFGQATVLTIPDPGVGAANYLLTGGTQQMLANSQLNFAKVNGTEAANAVTASGQSGVITTSALTTAGAASYAITWTNTHITATSTILLTISGGTNTTENVTLKVTPGAGTATLTIYNNTAATALNGTLLISYLVC